jgi:hypothetical protein
MAHRWDPAMVERDGMASLCVGSMRDQVSMRDYPMRDCVVAYARLAYARLCCSLSEFPLLGDALGGFIYAAS